MAKTVKLDESLVDDVFKERLGVKLAHLRGRELTQDVLDEMAEISVKELRKRIAELTGTIPKVEATMHRNGEMDVRMEVPIVHGLQEPPRDEDPAGAFCKKCGWRPSWGKPCDHLSTEPKKWFCPAGHEWEESEAEAAKWGRRHNGRPCPECGI